MSGRRAHAQWCDDANQAEINCYVQGDGAHMWPYCCVSFSALAPMLQMQDRYMPERGSKCGRGQCANFNDVRTWYYNEVIVDKKDRPWEPDLPEMIEAVFVSPWASEPAMAYARAVRDALVRLLQVEPQRLPLLSYDHTATSEPFAPCCENE